SQPSAAAAGPHGPIRLAWDARRWPIRWPASWGPCTQSTCPRATGAEPVFVSRSKTQSGSCSRTRGSVADRIRVVARGAGTHVGFDHPPRNLYDLVMRDDLCEVLAGVAADPSVRVLVFRAEGDHFSAGADLREFGTAPSLWAMRDARWGRDVWGLLRAVAVPMVASMQGFAVGFGFELALQCDYRLAADDCVVALPEARIGMIPAGGASQTLPRVAGVGAGLT